MKQKTLTIAYIGLIALSIAAMVFSAVFLFSDKVSVFIINAFFPLARGDSEALETLSAALWIISLIMLAVCVIYVVCGIAGLICRKNRKAGIGIAAAALALTAIPDALMCFWWMYAVIAAGVFNVLLLIIVLNALLISDDKKRKIAETQQKSSIL